MLEALRRGLSNPEIAEALGISRATVKYHLVNIYSKTGVNDREAAAALDAGESTAGDAPVAHRRRWALAPLTVLRGGPARIGAAATVAFLPLVVVVVALLGWARPGSGPQDRVPVVATNAPTNGEAWDALRARPLLYGQLPGGVGCPVTPTHALDVADDWEAAGAGRVARLGPVNQSFSLNTGTGVNELGLSKSAWTADASTDPRVLLRGSRIDGDGLLTFGPGKRATEGRITADSGQSRAPDDNARVDVFIRESGCYAIQADTAGGSQVFVFYGLVGPLRPTPPDVRMPSLGSGAPIAVEAGQYPWLYFAATPSSDPAVPVGDTPDLVSSSHDPRWSPDGTRIAWSTSAGIAIATASNPTEWAAVGPPVNGAASWSPDGTHLVAAHRPDPTLPRANLVMVDPDTASSEMLTDGEAVDWQPAWSPDGRSVAFIRGQGTAADVYVVDIETRAVTRITAGMAAAAPAWSPDGHVLAFESRVGQRESVWVVGADGSDPHEVSAGLSAALQPAWSPDGGALIFSGSALPVDDPAWPGTAFDLYRVDPDGSGLTSITTDPASEWAPEWLARATLRYLSSATGPSEVWELDLETGVKTRLTRTDGGGVAGFDSRR